MRQKIISTAYTNFSGFWLAFVLIIGSLIIAIESVLEFVVVWLELHGFIKTPSIEWFSNDVLQLQRMVHEELGLGTWNDCTGPRAIPITEKGELLGLLDRGNPTHPIYVKPETSPECSGSPEGRAEKIEANVSEEASSSTPYLERQNSAENATSTDTMASGASQITPTSRPDSVDNQIAASTQLSPRPPANPSP